MKSSFRLLQLKRHGMLMLAFLLLMALSLLCARIPVGYADGGRDFAGFYAATNPTDLGGQFQVTLTARVFNYSGTDVANATITLQDPLVPGTDYGSFNAISIIDGDSTSVSADFTIPGNEYARWQSGGDPSMRIGYQDSSGNVVQRRIELAQMPGGVN